MKLLYRVPLVRRLFYSLHPTQAEAAELWDFIASRNGYTVVSLGNPKGEAVVRDLLSTMGVISPTSFLHHHVLPIVRGQFRGVYLPYQPGDPQSGFSPWEQVVDCVHLLALLAQMREGVSRYYLDPVTRGYQEWLAFRSDHEVWWRYQGRLPPAGRTAGRLLEYGCDLTEAELVEDRLEDARSVIRQGELGTPAARAVAAWVDEKYDLYGEERHGHG